MTLKVRGTELIGVKFLSLKRVHTRQSRGTRKQRISQKPGSKNVYLLHHKLINNFSSNTNFIRIIIASFNKKSLEEIATLIIDRVTVLPTRLS